MRRRGGSAATAKRSATPAWQRQRREEHERREHGQRAGERCQARTASTTRRLDRAVSCYNTRHDRDVLDARRQDRRANRPTGVSGREPAPGEEVFGNELRAWRGRGSQGVRWGWDGASLESAAAFSHDPIGYTDDTNIYEYVGDAPTGLTDPSGERMEPVNPPIPLPGRCRAGEQREYRTREEKVVKREETRSEACMMKWTCPDGTQWQTEIPGHRTVQRTVTYTFPAGTLVALKCSGGHWLVFKADRQPNVERGQWRRGECLPDSNYPPTANPTGLCSCPPAGGPPSPSITGLV